MTDDEIGNFALHTSNVVRALLAEGTALLPLEHVTILRACADELDNAVENHELAHTASPLLADVKRRLAGTSTRMPWDDQVDEALALVGQRVILSVRLGEIDRRRREVEAAYKEAVSEEMRALSLLADAVPAADLERVALEIANIRSAE